jgi:hypothetical protein
MTVPTMSTNGHAPSLLGKVTAVRIPTARRRAARVAGRRLWAQLQPVALVVSGLGFLAGAAWTVAVWAGLVATGAALLVLEWRLTN